MVWPHTASHDTDLTRNSAHLARSLNLSRKCSFWCQCCIYTWRNVVPRTHDHCQSDAMWSTRIIAPIGDTYGCPLISPDNVDMWHGRRTRWHQKNILDFTPDYSIFFTPWLQMTDERWPTMVVFASAPTTSDSIWSLICSAIHLDVYYQERVQAGSDTDKISVSATHVNPGFCDIRVTTSKRFLS